MAASVDAEAGFNLGRWVGSVALPAPWWHGRKRFSPQVPVASATGCLYWPFASGMPPRPTNLGRVG